MKLGKFILLLFVIPTFLFSGCRINNGDIGPLFGSWLLYSMTVDGQTPDDFSDDSTFWEFQNNIIAITQVDSHFQKHSRFGTWTEDDHTLYLDFTHSTAEYPSGTGSYQAPEWLYMPSGTVIPLIFINANSDHMSLSFNDNSGHTIIYNLRKIW